MGLALKTLLECFEEDVVNELFSDFEIANAYEKIPEILRFLGLRCKCERVYIFEISSNYERISNTYEWCNENVISYKDNFQDEPISLVEWTLELLRNREALVLDDIEELKVTAPGFYFALKTQKINKLIHAPLYHKDRLLGFVGIDNYDLGCKLDILSHINSIAIFLSELIYQKQIIEACEFKAFNDPLTRKLNKCALESKLDDLKALDNLGVVYCSLHNITWDKYIESNANQLFISAFKALESVFESFDIYRVSDDDFVILFPNIENVNFEMLLFKAKQAINKNKFSVYIAMGSAYMQREVDAGALILQAKRQMQEYKRCNEFYKDIIHWMNSPIDNESSDRIASEFGNIKDENFNQFIKNNVFDLDFFYNVLSITDIYPYFGDLSNNKFYISNRMKDLFGFLSNVVDDFLKLWSYKMVHSEDVEAHQEDIADILCKRKSHFSSIYRVETADGVEIWVQSSGAVKFDETGQKPLFFSGVVRKLEYNFIIDPITNLQREGAAIKKLQELKRENGEISIIGFKANNFEHINAYNGRETANNLLRDISTNLIDRFEDEVQFFRLDGLRFAGIVLSKNMQDLHGMASEIHDIIKEKYTFHGIAFSNACSIGVMDQVVDKDEPPHETLVNLNNLLELAKSKPDDKYVLYSASDVKDKKQNSEMVMTICKNVVDNFENFRVVIQPVVYSKEFKMLSGEMLLRWKFNGQDIPPAEFIPILEKNNLITIVGKWVFEQAVKNAKRIVSVVPGFKLNFNVSYNQIKDSNFVCFMREKMQEYQLDPGALIMELTENHYNEDPDKLLKFIDNCKNLGMKIALDDFGSGYSSMELLLKYPSDIVKLDKSLLKNMANSDENMDFINSIVYACHQFNKDVCIEGVETEEQLKFTIDAGCDMIQGFYLYRPMELNTFYDHLVR